MAMLNFVMKIQTLTFQQDNQSGTTTVRFGDGENGARLPTGADRVVAAYRSSKRFVAVVQQQRFFHCVDLTVCHRWV